MLRILVNAYACSPNMGSEPGMGWNWISHLAQFCELYIITEGEFREKIENAVASMPHGKNMHFYYNPVDNNIRQMCWNQGDWRFYRYYRKWQWKTYLMAKEICLSTRIDVLHQLNMIGFREPGYLWKLSQENNVPFVWGPIGGLKQFPTAYLKGSDIRMQLFMRMKNFLNVWQLKYDKRVSMALKTAVLLISSIPDSYKALKKYKGFESVVIPETGCFDRADVQTYQTKDGLFHVMWTGKFDFRKQLPLALEALSKTYNQNIVLDVYGSGTVEQIAKAKNLAVELGIANQVVWHGSQSNDVVMDAMRRSDLFLFTSVSEDTSTVVMEAISNYLPVVCFDTCGMSAVVDNFIGRKVPLSSPMQSAQEFADLLNLLEGDRFLLKRMSENCKKRAMELSWDSKAQTVKRYYNMIVHGEKQNGMIQITPPHTHIHEY